MRPGLKVTGSATAASWQSVEGRSSRDVSDSAFEAMTHGFHGISLVRMVDDAASS